MLLLEDGSVFGCGSNEVGQIGLGENVQASSDPTRIEGVGVVESLSAGLGFSLFKSMDGLYVTGNNFYGQLCVNAAVGDNVMTPNRIIDSVIDGTIIYIDTNIVSTFEAIKSSSFILFKDGSVGACGRNNFGQLGDGKNADVVRTVIDPLPNGVPIRKLGVGPSSESAFFVNDNGIAYATGLNDRGQLGVGDNVNRNSLTEVDFGGGTEIAQISAAGDHTLSR